MAKKSGGRTKALSKAGAKFDQAKALVVLRRGNAIDQAKVLEKHSQHAAN